MLVLLKHLYPRRMMVKIACAENDRTSLFSATCGNEDSELLMWYSVTKILLLMCI